MEPAKGNIFGRWIPTRYLVAFLTSIGLGIVYGLKVNLHVTIITMVNNTAIRLDHEKQASTNLSKIFTMPNITEDVCVKPTASAASMSEDGPFVWSKRVQGAVLSAYFWGYLAGQVPGGAAAEALGAKWVLWAAVAANVACTLLTPPLARLHYAGLLAARLGEGLAGGATFPAAHALLARWAPPAERSVLSSVVYSGTALGTVVFMLASGVIAGTMGWAAVFYLQGGICCAWLILWVIFVSDSPETQTHISAEERKYIMDSLKDASEKTDHKRRSTPWRSIFTSKAFLAILVAHVCSNWGWYMVLIELPLYFKDILDINIKESALLTSAPFFFMWLFSMVLSKVIDSLRAKEKLSTTAARKIATLISCVVPLFCFLLLSYIGCQRTLAIVLMTIAVTSIGGMFCGFLSNHIDIAPNYAGTLMAITNTLATIPGIVVPNFVGYLTASDPSIASWRIIFWTTIVLYVIEILAYSMLGSGEVQQWNNPPDNIEAQPLNATSPTSEQKSYEATAPMQTQS